MGRTTQITLGKNFVLWRLVGDVKRDSNWYI